VETIAEAIGRFLNSPGFKFFLICGLILLLTIPLLLVWGLIEEREKRAEGIQQEVAREWGGAQLINGPVLIVPYAVLRVSMQAGKRTEETLERRAVFLPRTLNVRAKAATKVLRRSIYDVAVYTGDLQFEGRFDAPDLSEVEADVQSVRWHDAILAIGISDVSGLKKAASLFVDGGTEIPFEPSLGVAGARDTGIHARLASLPGLSGEQTDGSGFKGFNYRFSLVMNGSAQLSFAPVAQQTTVGLSSDWPDPSFTGAFLPTDRVLNPAAISARWEVPHLARSVPQAWTLGSDGLNRLSSYAFGMRFIVPVDFYQVVARAAKYAMMFLATAFMAVFVLELGSKREVHPVQYLLVGLAMAFFYVLLLSLAEQIGFLPSYLAASGATVMLIATYVGSVQRSFVEGLIMLCVLVILYGLLYMILQLEDYALLAGAIAGFVMLAAVMFGTLRVDWWGKQKAPPDGQPSAQPISQPWG